MKRKFRVHRAWCIGAAGVALSLGTALVVARPASSRHLDLIAAYDPLRTAAQGPVLEDRLSVVEELEIRAGETLAAALYRADIPAELVEPLLQETAVFVDLRRIRPSDTFQVHRNRQGEFARLCYQRRPEEWVEVEKAGDGFRASRRMLPVETYIRKLEGRVDENLYLTLMAAGGDPALVVEFADLFSWDFDFFTETRTGDAFRLLVEERRVEGQCVGHGRILAGEYKPEGGPLLSAYFHAWGNDEEERGYYDGEGRSLRKFFLKSPLNYRRISSHFTHRRFHPITKKFRPHLGVDYAAPTGTPVVALGSGRVVRAGWIQGFGNTVQIRHNDTFLTQYAHLSKYARGVRAGTRVRQGDVIGFVGQTGHATGPHLDFRVQQNGKWVNPLGLASGPSDPLPSAERAAFLARTVRARRILDTLRAGEGFLESDPESAPALARLDTPSAS